MSARLTLTVSVAALAYLPGGLHPRLAGQEPVGSPTADFQAFFKSEVARFARVIEAAKIPKID